MVYLFYIFLYLVVSLLGMLVLMAERPTMITLELCFFWILASFSCPLRAVAWVS